MANDLKNSLEEIRKLVASGDKDTALKKVDELLGNEDMKPYEDALKKIKVDIIYALNLERINSELGKKAYNKVVSEIDSVVGNPAPPADAPPHPPAERKKTGAPAPAPQGPPSYPLPPPPPVPLVRFEPPPEIKEILNSDPYDIENLSIEHEIGPLGILNDMRRTFVSIFDPLLPIKMLEKETKKKK